MIHSRTITDNSEATTAMAMVEFRACAIIGKIQPPAEDYDPDERPADEDRPADALVCPDCQGKGEIVTKATVPGLVVAPYDDMLVIFCKTCGATGEMMF